MDGGAIIRSRRYSFISFLRVLVLRGLASGGRFYDRPSRWGAAEGGGHTRS